MARAKNSRTCYAFFPDQEVEYGPFRTPEQATAWLTSHDFRATEEPTVWLEDKHRWRAEIRPRHNQQLGWPPRSPTSSMDWPPTRRFPLPRGWA